ncbi:MAG: protein kinase [Myxococcota bacterium]|nr:protein kinase [Myxococcota bacterium]
MADRFETLAELGRGGMGVVHRARDTASGEEVALKLLSGEDAIDVARFEREARVLARVRHPHVVRYVDHGRTPDGRVYLAMALLEGETLGERIARGGLGPAEAVLALEGAASGLGAAHAAGIVHRDVKPGNLFLVDRDPARVQVLDFGIARGLGAGHTLTTTGTVIGTPFYMAPEQARAAEGVDARADVYALGAVLYEILTGEPPFRSESLMAVLAAILLEEPVDVRQRTEVPEPIAALTMRLLAKDPAARPADGAALAALCRALDAAQPAARRALPDALTEREQRVRCLVVAGGRFHQLAHAATLRPGEDDALGRAREAVQTHGGSLELLADGSMVARVDEGGAPVDQAVRAARCAMALRELLPEAPLAAVAGRGQFHGPVPVGEVIERASALLGALAGAATLKRGALGPSPNPSALPPGGDARAIRLDDAMASLLDGRFEVERDETSALLGRERRTPTTTRTLLGKVSPCVGRRRELATLEALFFEAVEEPVARAVVLTAPAGLGKSRLITELRVRMDEEAEVWTARGDPVAAGSPFALVGQLVRAAAGLQEGESLDARRDALLRAVSRAVPGDAARPLAARLGELARVPFEAEDARIDDPVLRGDAMREAFLTWLGAALGRGPVAIVLDDLQHGDAPSLAYLDAALREHADAPLFVLAAGRPEIEERFGELWAEREAQPMRLTRLRAKAAEQLVRRTLEGVDDALVARIVERADGNPFFLEELVRAVWTHGPDASLPTTVLGMVEARLGRLEAPTRRVLRAASVFGRRFWRGGVEALLGGGSPCEPHLEVLRRSELIDPSEPSRFEGERELTFRHALTREAALAMLTEDDRRLGHRLAGDWLERAGERDALVLAAHFEAGGAPDRAAAWLGRAAEQALEGDDLPAAIALGQRALEAAADPGPIRVTLADAHRWRGEYAPALEHATAAADALEPGGRPWFRALGVIFAAAGRLRDGEALARWRRRAMTAEARDDAVGAQVVALCRAAAAGLGADDRGAFDEAMGRAEALAARVPTEPLPRAWIATLRASAALRAGDLGAFVEGTTEAVRAYEQAGDARDACNQRVRLGNALTGLGDVEGAEAVLREALFAARRMGLRVIEGYALQNLGHALLRRGALDEARETEERAVGLARALEDPVLEAGSLLYLAETLQRAGDDEGATRAAERAVALLTPVPGFRAVARAVLARVLRAGGATARALEEAERAHAALSSHALEEGEALIRLAFAEALDAAGRGAEATRVLEEAAAALEARAARIRDEGWRDAFLRRVPTHARVLEKLAAARESREVRDV